MPPRRPPTQGQKHRLPRWLVPGSLSLGIVLFRRKLPLPGKQLLPGGVNIQLVNAYPLREVRPPCLNAWELRRLFSATELMLHSPLPPFVESCFHHASADASPKNSPNKCPEHEFPSQSLFSEEQHQKYILNLSVLKTII